MAAELWVSVASHQYFPSKLWILPLVIGKMCLAVNVNFKCSFHLKWEKTTNIFHVGGNLELYSSSLLSSCSLTSGKPEGMAPWEMPVRGSQGSLKVTGGPEGWWHLEKKWSGFQDIQDYTLIINHFFFMGVFMLYWEISKGSLSRAWLEQFWICFWCWIHSPELRQRPWVLCPCLLITWTVL